MNDSASSKTKVVEKIRIEEDDNNSIEIKLLSLLEKDCQHTHNLRGFLKYLVGESSESSRIDKTIEALSECDKYVSITDQEEESIDNNSEYGQDYSLSNTHFWHYQIKENFPFLSFYKHIKKFLPEKFAAKLLKEK
jgi:hypothetical protein